MQQVQLYDDQLDFTENKARGPFGDYADVKEPYRDQGEPQYDFFGIPVYSPFGIGAGPLPTPRFIQAALDKGFDIVTLKNVRTGVVALNPYPQVRSVTVPGDLDPNSSVQVAGQYEDRLAIANSFGIPSVAPEEWQPYLKESFALPKKGQALLVAFQGTTHGLGREDFVQDHVKGVELIKQVAPDAVIEINLSCPNEPDSDNKSPVLACFDTDMSEAIAKAVRAANPDSKLLIKVAYFANRDQFKDWVKRIGPLVDGITAINTIPVPVLDETGETVFPGRALAGISGAPIKWAGLEMVRQLKQYRDEFGYGYKIIGLGGVLSAADFKEYTDTGADYVMSVTGAMWNPNLAAEVKASLQQ
jgi:dihydroorotate dehydrogenase (NAD+) catalytic subunit